MLIVKYTGAPAFSTIERFPEKSNPFFFPVFSLYFKQFFTYFITGNSLYICSGFSGPLSKGVGGMKKYVLLSVFAVVSLGIAPACFGADELKITKDRDGTTWSVGSGETREKRQAEEERDRDRAWNMLQNQSIILDRRTTK